MINKIARWTDDVINRGNISQGVASFAVSTQHQLTTANGLRHAKGASALSAAQSV